MIVGDFCGIFCILITYSAVFYADYVVIKWIIWQTMAASLWGAFNVLMFNVIVFLLFMAHARAVLTDPGTVPLLLNKVGFANIHSNSGCELADWTICSRCEIYRPPRAHHCRICKRCIRKMDHHCPWINNCVGEKNQKYFIQFLVYVGILSTYSIALLIVSWVIECNECNQDILVKQSRILHCVALLLESALFGMFVTAILIDQMQSIVNNETAVEYVQNQAQGNSKNAGMCNFRICSGKSILWWLLPCSSDERNYDAYLIYQDV